MSVKIKRFSYNFDVAFGGGKSRASESASGWKVALQKRARMDAGMVKERQFVESFLESRV